MSEIMKAKSDLFFRYLFGTQEHEFCRVDFINAVLQDNSIFASQDDNPIIVSTEVLNPFVLAEYKEDKESVLDIKAKDNFNRIINIEMQLRGNEDFSSRSLFYWSKIYSEQLESGGQYETLNPVICINVLDFIINQDFNEVHLSGHIFYDQHKETVLTKQLELHFLQLPRLITTPDLHTKINCWMEYFKKKTEGVDMNYVTELNPAINNANQLFNKFSASPKAREIYENHMKYQRDYSSDMKHKFDEGLAEGVYNTRIETAKTMILMNMDIDKISKISGLSIEEINKLI